jgi:hypothetical protein
VNRLTDETATPAALREMIEAARGDAPDAAAMGRMIARAERIGGGGGGGGGGGALAKLALVAGVIVIAGAVIWFVRRPEPDPEPETRTPVAVAKPEPESEPEPEPEPEPESEPAVPASRVGTSSPPRSPPAEEAPERPYTIERTKAKPKTEVVKASEVEIVEKARGALAASQWKNALAGAIEHAKQYPDGVLAEEREAIAVEALTRLGRADAARDRLGSFLRRYPRSSYRRHLEGL